MADSAPPAGPPANPHLWSRGGFAGDMCVTVRPHSIVGYSSVAGPHAPRILDLHDLEVPDRADPNALPVVFAASRDEVSLLVSAREAPTPFAWRNVEYDELHFVQDGVLDYVTDFGTLRAEPGDIVFFPRSVTYRVEPVTSPTLRLIVETPQQLLFQPPAPFGMVNAARDVRRADPSLPSTRAGETRLLLRAHDGITEYHLAHDPMAMVAVVSGQVPVWKLNLAVIQPSTYHPHGGPPESFARTAGDEVMVFTLSARPGGRPPMHHNADYDEVILYHRGPGAYGALNVPGTLTWTPKGVSHRGPVEDVPEGYLALLIETTATFRLTDIGQRASHPMETDLFGRHESAETT